ncbi:MAG: autotransporter-associated beta strand repeat-containing protein [Prevotellaceae bacterium]|nr:autotransporter-associated beta strand repeat-containing protein [Prevotellaceae bacterium]
MKKFLFVLCVAMIASLQASAQRKQNLGRGVVATYSGSSVLVTWRRLIQDPEDAGYNVYVAKAGGEYTKVTASPLKLTNYSSTLSAIPNGSSIYVTMVDADGKESEPSQPFTLKQVSLGGTLINNAYLHVNYKNAGSPLPYTGGAKGYNTKFCWPVDLDGDGEMEYVVDRLAWDRNMNGYSGNWGDCLEAYSSKGEHLWTIDLGPNIWLSNGQNDCVTVGDFDGDGKGEVMVEASDGTRLWNKQNKTFGKYIAYGNNDGSSADTDGDGIVNYTSYDSGKNPQYYMLVIDGETGAQKDIVPMTLPSDRTGMKYTRDNKKEFMNDEYPWMMGAMGTAYLDGVTPSAVIQFQLRRSSDGHHYFTYAYGYKGGKFQELWTFAFRDNGYPSEFHHIRIGDVDGDGKDEIMNGACAIDEDGTLLWNSGISHGDRFRMSDIDPDRPGQEIFAIQQNAPDMLGMILYDATDGSAIKKWYLSSVGDVGRGECMDVDPKHKGYEIWSTMPNMYNAKGDAITTEKPYPYEGIWWDGNLDRESLMTPGSGNNPPVVIAEYNGTGTWARLNQISSNSGWRLAAEYGVRPMFFGDICGDWREELILKQLDNGAEAGFVALTTDYKTSIDNIYCLLQDPNYFGQITNRGYYQSPNTSFYLGYDMPRPPLPPFIQADAENKVFGLTLGNATITPSASAKNIYAMPVKGQTLTLSAPLGGSANLWKSQQGTLVVNSAVTTTGATIVSQGTLQVDGSISGNVELRARGILSGKGSVGSLTFEGSLNYAEGVVKPLGTLTVNSDLTIDQNTYIEINIDNNSLLKVNGTFTVAAPVVFNINATDPQEGEYKLIEYSNEFSGAESNFSVRGLKGKSYNIINKDKIIYLKINGQRDPANGVSWTGAESNVWDYQTLNWSLNNDATTYVANDGITFGDDAKGTTIQVPELMPFTRAEINSTQTYTFQGDGGFSGEGMLVKNGTGRLVLNNTKSDYTGATVINAGSVTVKELADAGIVSSIGAASADAENFKIGKATLTINNTNTATNRGITLTDTATISIASGTSSFKGIVKGNGTLLKAGAGQLNITYAGENSWAGTILQAGTLAMGAWNTTFGKATSPIHVTGNSTIVMFDVNNSSTMPNFQNALTIDEGKTLTFYATSRGYIRGSLAGKGTIKMACPYVRGDISTNVSQFEGTYEILKTEKGNNRFVQAMNFEKATLKLGANTYLAGNKSGSGDEVNYTHKVGSMQGSGTLSTGTWNVGYLGNDDTFAGSFNGAATVNKYGSGTWTLSGASAGPLNIYEGEVCVTTTSAPATTGAITVRSGATLSGTGQVQNVTVQKDGILGAGRLASAVGTLTVKGSLTLNSGAILRVRTRSTATRTNTDAFNVSGNIKLTSPIIQMSELNSSYTYTDDAELKVFTGTGKITISGDITILPETPKAGWLWDASSLATDGIIRIVPDPVGIRELSADSLTENDVIYDMAGRRIKTVTASGSYIVNGIKVYIKK